MPDPQIPGTPDAQAPAPVVPPAVPDNSGVPPTGATPAPVTPPAPAPAGTPPVVPPAGDAPKPADAPPAVPPKVAPEKYDVKAPEGSLLKGTLMDSFLADAKKRGLSNDEAQAELNQKSQEAGAVVNVLQEEHKARVQQWGETLKADPEFGGEALAQNHSNAQVILKHFGDAELLSELDRTGYGSHPAFFRFLAKIGKATQSDKTIFTGAVGGDDAGKTRAQRLYPGMNP